MGMPARSSGVRTGESSGTKIPDGDGANADQWLRWLGIADDIGDLFVLDRRTDTIVVMNQDGKLLDSIASKPGGAGDFSYPSALAVGPRAEIYVYDEKRKTILRFF